MREYWTSAPISITLKSWVGLFLDVSAWGGSFSWACLSSATWYRCGCTRSVAARPAKTVAPPGAITGLFTLTHIAGAVAAVALTARSGSGRDFAWAARGRISPAADVAAHDHSGLGSCRMAGTHGRGRLWSR
jgi:hypothetical protein